ncbi:MAG: hypothetical protein ACMZ7B_10895 [Balneola sp.]
MKTNSTYRFVASLLCVSIICSFAFPVFGMAEMIEHCMDLQNMDTEMHSETDMSMHHHSAQMAEPLPIPDSMGHGEMMDCCSDMHDSGALPIAIDHCQTSIDCDCDATYDGVSHTALVVQNFKIPLDNSTIILSHSFNSTTKITPPPLWFSSSYSPPLLFLANESFLI